MESFPVLNEKGEPHGGAFWGRFVLVFFYSLSIRLLQLIANWGRVEF